MEKKQTSIKHSLKEKLGKFPENPGVYIFKDNSGRILYVGKAKNLRKRVLSYLRNNFANGKTEKMLQQVETADFMVTATEKEALLLEANLIKQYRPRYNVILTDDKNYPCLRIDTSQPYPRIEIVRKIKNDGAIYFGPFPSAKSVRHTLRTVKRMFPLRQCKSKKIPHRSRPCLNFQIGRCLGPCSGKVPEEEYNKVLQEAVLFLQGKTDLLQNQLEQKMREASERLDFERAAIYRDRLEDIRRTLQAQRIVSTRFVDRDIVAVYGENGSWLVEMLFVRQGALLDSRDYFFPETWLCGNELVESFITQFYHAGRYIPDEILVSVIIDSAGYLSEWLSDKKGRKVVVKKPLKGEGKQLVALAMENAEKHFRMREIEKRDYLEIKGLFQKAFRMKEPPSYIACVDISHFQGEHPVGSLVVFHEGKPLKDNYRRFRMRSGFPANDPAMIRELLERYLSDHREDAEKLNLLIVDGGRAQLNTACKVLKEKGYSGLPVISIAKGSHQWLSRHSEKSRDRIYLPNRKNPVSLHSAKALYLFIQQIRDEAHRFAVSYQQKKYRKQLTTSTLEDIPGVGKKRSTLLLKHFGSIREIANASLNDLLSVQGLPKSVAGNIYEYFRNTVKEKAS